MYMNMTKENVRKAKSCCFLSPKRRQIDIDISSEHGGNAESKITYELELLSVTEAPDYEQLSDEELLVHVYVYMHVCRFYICLCWRILMFIA